MRSIVYHQFRQKLHIIKALALYIIIAKEIHATRDDMRLTAMIYTPAV